MQELLASVAVFTLLMMSLVSLVLLARRLMAPRGVVTLRVNGSRTLSVSSGQRLLDALVEAGIHLPAACGGKGSCGLCRVQVTSGGSPLLPLEADRFSRRELAEGARLACQVTMRSDLDAWVAEEMLSVQVIETQVRSTAQLATLIKELVLAVPPEVSFSFRTGSFVQVHCPPYSLRYADLDVDAVHHEEWDRLDLWRHVAESKNPTVRAYSLANHSGEAGSLMLIVRLATPPPRAARDVPPGVVSSWLFGLQAGDAVTVSGPFGEFFVDDSDSELVFVGGGAGMGPLRAHIVEQLERLGSPRQITFFYGARNLRELFYAELFDRLQKEHENFRWVVALSEPRADDAWDSRTGYIHEHLREWVDAHPAPQSCAYYLCGPPLMLRAVKGVLEGAGVPARSVHADDFGGGS